MGNTGRIGKSSVHNSLGIAGKNILDARGKDHVASRKEIKGKVAELPNKKEAGLTRQFAAFIDARDAKLGARITAKDVEKALAYAKDHVLDKYDTNNDGFSRAEVAKMSKLGQLAIEFTLQQAGRSSWVDSNFAQVGGKEIAASLEKTLKGVEYMSESDYPYWGISAKNAGNKSLSGELAMSAFKGEIEKFFKENADWQPLNELTAEVYSAADSKDFITPDPESEDAAEKKAMPLLAKQLAANFTDWRVIKVGPRDEDNGKLAADQGTYAYLIVGRTKSGEIAGVMTGAAET